MHAQAALVGARAALARNRLLPALRFLEPFLHGAAPLPEPMLAGAMAVIAASILGAGPRGTAEELCGRPADGAESIGGHGADGGSGAWAGGLADRAWRRFAADSPWLVAARAELAVLAGESRLAMRLMQQAGKYASPSAPALSLLRGEFGTTPGAEGTRHMFGAGVKVHIWRTHPYRWRPWLDAALQTDADVAVFDLAAGLLPEAQSIPDVVLDDGSLAELLPQVQFLWNTAKATGFGSANGSAAGIGIGHDWPEDETAVALDAVRRATSAASAAVMVCSADAAFEGLCRAAAPS